MITRNSFGRPVDLQNRLAQNQPHGSLRDAFWMTSNFEGGRTSLLILYPTAASGQESTAQRGSSSSQVACSLSNFRTRLPKTWCTALKLSDKLSVCVCARQVETCVRRSIASRSRHWEQREQSSLKQIAF